MKQAEQAIHYGQAYDHICNAIKHLDEAGELDHLIGVGLISHAMPAITARDHILDLLVPAMQACGLVELEEARIKILGQ